MSKAAFITGGVGKIGRASVFRSLTKAIRCSSPIEEARLARPMLVHC